MWPITPHPLTGQISLSDLSPDRLTQYSWITVNIRLCAHRAKTSLLFKSDVDVDVKNFEPVERLYSHNTFIKTSRKKTRVKSNQRLTCFLTCSFERFFILRRVLLRKCVCVCLHAWAHVCVLLHAISVTVISLSCHHELCGNSTTER